MKHNFNSTILKDSWFRVFLFALIFGSFTSCKLSEVQFKGVKNYEFVKASTESISMKIAFEVENPSAFNIKVKPANLDLYLDDKLVGDLKIDEKVKIKKRSEGIYEMPVTAFFDKGLPLSTIMKGRVTAKIDGKIKAKVFIIGKKFEVTETMPLSLNSLF